MSVSRRSFLKIAAATSGAMLPTGAQAGDAPPTPDTNGLGVLVDTTYCIGCRKCELGCNEANDLPKRERASFEDKSVLRARRRPDATAYTVINQVAAGTESAPALYGKSQCMHCLKPACVSACIVGALQRSKEGPVIYDAWKCIGCRYCMVACPFQIPAYEYSVALAPKVQKCSFCYERTVTGGKKPACVDQCPNEALTFGPRRDVLKLAHMKIAANPARYNGRVYGEHEAGGTSWLYLAGPSVDFAALDLPALDHEPIPTLTEAIQHSVFKGFVPPVALYGLLGLLMWSHRRDDEEGGHG